jgi:hypothetical protein
MNKLKILGLTLVMACAAFVFVGCFGGYYEGWDDGYLEGYLDGMMDGYYGAGYLDGFDDGEYYGYWNGYDDGFDDGEYYGWNNGWDEGFIAGADSIPLPPENLRITMNPSNGNLTVTWNAVQGVNQYTLLFTYIMLTDYDPLDPVLCTGTTSYLIPKNVATLKHEGVIAVIVSVSTGHMTNQGIIGNFSGFSDIEVFIIL